MKPPALIAIDGTQASNFSFGTMQFGGNAGKEESQQLFEASRAAGINFFDTAYVYTEGRSEQYLGEFSAVERDSLVIASKCASVGGANSVSIRSQHDESRTRLNMDVIDVFYLHQWDHDTPLEETFSTLAELRETGMIRYIGVSNYSAWQTMKAANVAEKLGICIDILQPMYNLVKRQVEVEILPMAISESFNVAPYSPLGGGLLTGKYSHGASGRISDDENPGEWEQMIRLNILGVLWTVKAAMPYLKERKGHLLLTGSAAGRRHISGSVYGATKWFVHGYGGNLSEEMKSFGGRCTVVAPGMVDTPFFDAPKPDKLQPEDVADAAMHALNANPRCAVNVIFLMPTK